MNSTVFVILFIFILGQCEDDLDKRYTHHESKTFCSYSCDERSYFHKVSRSLTDYFKIECNAVYQGRTNYTVVATLPNGKDVPLNIVHSCFALRDVNGSEVYSNLGVVRDGHCIGAIIYIYGMSRVEKGSCDSPSGVKVVEVPNNHALFTIRGTCDSTCWGKATTVYNPGKYNYIESGLKGPGYPGDEEDQYQYYSDFKRLAGLDFKSPSN